MNHYLSPGEQRRLYGSTQARIKTIVEQHGWTYERTDNGWIQYAKGKNLLMQRDIIQAPRLAIPPDERTDEPLFPELRKRWLTDMLFKFAATEELSTYEAINLFWSAPYPEISVTTAIQ